MTTSGTAARPGSAAARLRQVTSALAAALPDLPVGDIPTVMAAARADRGIPLREIATYLAAHPDALNSGTADCPTALVRLTRVLRNAGQATVVEPGCAECGRTGLRLERRGPNGLTCGTCHARAHVSACARCHRVARIAARRDDGGICYPCYNLDSEVVEECAGCGRPRRPATRRDTSDPP